MDSASNHGTDFSKKDKELVGLGSQSIKLPKLMCNSIKTYCLGCLGANVKKNGLFNKAKTQQYKCKSCGKKFFVLGSSYFVSNFKKDLLKDLLLERLSLCGICRVLKVSLSWLLAFLKEIWSDLPDDLNVKLKGVKNWFQVVFTSKCVNVRQMSYGVSCKRNLVYSIFGWCKIGKQDR